MGQKVESANTFSNFLPDNWVWDTECKPREVTLSADQTEAYFFIDPVTESIGTAGVRGNRGFQDGRHFWEIIFLEPPAGTSVMVGVGTQQAPLFLGNYQYVNLIGVNKESWGLSYKGTICHAGKSSQYCEPFYNKRTTIGCFLDIQGGTLTFFKNGIDLGVAFWGMDLVGEPLYPLISSTAAETELALGKRICSSRYLSLQELCCITLRRNVPASLVDCLPLPKPICQLVKNVYY
ncbi:SPRY domain-containing SOCS box protein 3-like [Gigantopelta aegis]|uniref:SPRY domain-containing SOCS box protein 3-like n=1 Tax=Gigantopelta aegis TaxID=1735272 RepID=UPI001B88C00E|nr:SPRY domain-containing SOCS box protein 3-like [Gigantopelta aegis]